MNQSMARNNEAEERTDAMFGEMDYLAHSVCHFMAGDGLSGVAGVVGCFWLVFGGPSLKLTDGSSRQVSSHLPEVQPIPKRKKKSSSQPSVVRGKGAGFISREGPISLDF